MKKHERAKIRRQLLQMTEHSKKVCWPRFVIFDHQAIEIVERAAAVIEILETKLRKAK